MSIKTRIEKLEKQIETPCFMCGAQSCHTIENCGRKERVCSKCAAILVKGISKKHNGLMPVMIKVAGKYKSMFIAGQIIVLSPEQIRDLERVDDHCNTHQRG